METSRVFMKREPGNRAATQINYIKDRDNCKVDGFDTDERGALAASRRVHLTMTWAVSDRVDAPRRARP